MGVMRHIPRETTTATFTVISLFARPDVQKKNLCKIKTGFPGACDIYDCCSLCNSNNKLSWEHRILRDSNDSQFSCASCTHSHSLHGLLNAKIKSAL